MSRTTKTFTTARCCLTLCVGTALALGATGASSLAADQQQVPATNAGTVEAQPVGEPFEPFFVPAPEGAEPVDLRPMHPPISEIPAMEMPDDSQMPKGGITPGFGQGQPVIYDQKTGLERLLPAPVTTEGIGGVGAPGSGFGGLPSDGLAEWAYQGLEGFGTKTHIPSVGSNPWRMNCKLVIEYEDSNPNVSPIYRVCSAGMADAETILTAGHCIYKHDLDSNGVKYGWADRIWVYPGWDGDGLALGTPGIIDTHGWGQSSSLSAFTGWTVDANWDWDMGLIRITRAVGMLTGWYNWAWGGDCGPIMDLSYNVGSYPSENCGGGLHNGQDQYYWFGSIDSCPGNRMQIDTGSGCLTALWGGESGSNLYYFIDDNRHAHGVASTSDRSTYGRYCKMWESFKDNMIDFENNSRTSTFDLQALQARFSPTTITAGQATTSETVQVPNPTNANPASSSYPLSIRLSTNSNISSFDTNLANQSYTFNYAAMQNVNLNMGSVTIPKNTPSGTYWLGVLLNDGIDSTNSNNDTDLWDAQQITVNGVADLVAVTANVNSISYPQYSTIPMYYNVTNEGGDSSNFATMSVRASTNNIISTFDTEIASFGLGTFSGGQTKDGTVDITIPALAPGNYYIGIIVTASDDIDSSNDWDADSAPITVFECLADFTHDGIVDAGDLGQFITWYLAADLRADLTGDGIVDAGDLGDFITLYLAGC